MVAEILLKNAMKEAYPEADIHSIRLSAKGHYIAVAVYGYDFDCPDVEICLPKLFVEALLKERSRDHEYQDSRTDRRRNPAWQAPAVLPPLRIHPQPRGSLF